MELKVIDKELTICKLADEKSIDLSEDFYFIGKTDDELSLVCESDKVPANVTDREDGWRGFRIEGLLDFSLVGILAPIAQTLAESKVGIFAVSTFNTDYILVRKENFDRAVKALRAKGYAVNCNETID